MNRYTQGGNYYYAVAGVNAAGQSAVVIACFDWFSEQIKKPTIGNDSPPPSILLKLSFPSVNVLDLKT